MGGFEGGDEGGYWDDDIPTELPKANKMQSYVQKDGLNYSLQAYSENEKLFDTISLVPCSCKAFTLDDYRSTPIEQSDIYKSYNALLKYTNDMEIEELFYEYKVVISKSSFSESNQTETISHSKAFIYLVKEVCNLILRDDEIEEILKK